MDTSRYRAVEAIERHRHGMHPPLWRALHDLVEGRTELTAEHSDLLAEVAEKSEGTLSWGEDRVLSAELALAQWLAGDALSVCGHEPLETPADVESTRRAAGQMLRLSIHSRARGDEGRAFYGSGIKGAMELIYQFPGPRPSDPLHGEIVRLSRSFSSDLARGDESTVLALRGGFLRTLAGTL